MRVLSVSELGRCVEGCRWVCGGVIVADVGGAAELALALKKTLGGEAYVNGRDIHLISERCYIVLTVEERAGGVAVRNALGWGSVEKS
ncbi:hypothetical protein ODS41_10320 [Pyrobaculum sp. 3827-6]|uniref:hypothetical protein n=1 Tax=Pyrobaculum sp. 3827-6 TaxID=2983604 RepID=UPI0021DA47E7|nr:hypothetical protein [Pyrobaculum sp. 3827-6]MCU7788304.1 hypothetical protein [Pyrobaculum sp. 3827-6]